jgi:alpha-ketoglutarate-dependent taurine dioxygenase
MGYTRIEVEPLTNVLGATVRGVDLREPLDEETISELSAAWVEHKVLFLRNQPIDRAGHKRFARYFGEIYRHPFLKDVANDPDFVELYSGGDTGRRFVAENWHTDVTFAPEPPMGSILRAIEVPAYGGDTMWLDLEAAYAGLSATMQDFASSLTAVHSAPRAAFVPGDTSGEAITSRHPIVRTHPVSGRKALFVNPVFTRNIAGLKRAESEALLAMFHTHCQHPDYQVRIHWEPDMIGMWDNRCTQHRVAADNLDALRKMERITLQGDAPF